MALNDHKIVNYSNPVSSLPDHPSAEGITAAALKAVFDSNANNEIKISVNGIINNLLSKTINDSGADNIGSTVIPGVTGENVRAQLVALKNLIDAVVLGQIPDGTITDAKLSNAPGQIKEQIENLFDNNGIVKKTYINYQYPNDKWYRLWHNDTSAQGINEILQVTSYSGTGAQAHTFTLLVNSVHNQLSVRLLSSSKVPAVIGITKIRAVFPNAQWTAGRYIDLFITGLTSTIEISCKKISVLGKSNVTTGIFAETLQEAPTISGTQISTEIEMSATPSGRVVTDVQPSWLNATLQSGWTGTLQYRKNQIGQIEIKFDLTAGTITASTNVTNLPADYRPSNLYSIILGYKTANGTGIPIFWASNSGNIAMNASSGVSTGDRIVGSAVLC